MLLVLLPVGKVWADDAVDVKQQRIAIALAGEPPNLNSLVTTDQISNFILAHVMEGLLQYDQHGQLGAGVAERWELRADGATFWLRRNARWSDGKPVTAQDFAFAWRSAVAPATASQYAPALFPIANAERINRGELPPAQLGVRAVNAYKLEVKFERPCPYFLGLTATSTFYPVREDFFKQRGERYAADADDLLYNGAFALTRWVHGAQLTLDRNRMYWNRAQVHLQGIDVPYITSDANALFNLYKNGNIALAQLEPETLQESITRGYPVKLFSVGTMFYWEFNLRAGRVAANKSFRRAIQALFDPELLVNKIVGLPGVRAADSLYPRNFKANEQAFIDVFPPPLPPRNLAQARQWLEQARTELGLLQFPPLILLCGDSQRAQKEAEYFQQLLSAGLGLQVRIDKQIFKQRLDKMTRGDFDIVAAAWGPDYDDLLTFGDLLASWNENNRGRYRSDEYDRWVSVAQREADPQKRLEAFAHMQRLLIEDVPLLMTYENAVAYVQHPQLQGVNRSIFGGDPNFRYARVVDVAKP
ncbi:MAG: peptide ABC transporter substrate-binding protein [Spongiibacteraceae bacterium]